MPFSFLLSLLYLPKNLYTTEGTPPHENGRTFTRYLNYGLYETFHLSLTAKCAAVEVKGSFFNASNFPIMLLNEPVLLIKFRCRRSGGKSL